MIKNSLTGLDSKKLRRWLILFFLALVIPTIILIQQSFGRLKWEAFHQHQLMAEELASRIDGLFLQLIRKEEQRPFTDYAFLNVAGNATTNYVQRSPLSLYPVESSIPGVIGYFQVDSSGRLQTPLIPESIESANSYGIPETELTARLVLQEKIRLILSQNQLVQVKNNLTSRMDQDKLDQVFNEQEAGLSQSNNEFSSAEIKEFKPPAVSASADYAPELQIQGQAAFDQLKKKSYSKNSKQQTKLGRLEDLSLTRRYQQESVKRVLIKPEKQLAQKDTRHLRTEESSLPEAVVIANAKAVDDFVISPRPAERVIPSLMQPLRISTFESEIDRFEFSRLDKGDFVLFRKVWLNNQRYIQGALIDQQVFLNIIINSAFRETSLSQMSDLLVSYQGNVLEAFSGRFSRGYISSSRELSGELLYQTRLSDPLNEIQLLFSITQLPAGPGVRVILWLSLVLGIILCGGFYLMYRLGVTQIKLVNQQQDFVSAVSHELKTPLTSIRLYAEMLKEGWASEQKKKTYYHFIVDESERLSRLINNVLLMARLTRNKQRVEMKQHNVLQLIESVESIVSSQIVTAGFELNRHFADEINLVCIEVDADWFAQIIINLVDNAIKFSAKTDNKIIVLGCELLSNDYIQFTVRDYGPGIAREQMKKIFQLFYRSENELTRETVGTGIGLALVHQMIVGMKGKIDVVNTQPGVEFRVSFQSYESD